MTSVNQPGESDFLHIGHEALMRGALSDALSEWVCNVVKAQCRWYKTTGNEPIIQVLGWPAISQGSTTYSTMDRPTLPAGEVWSRKRSRSVASCFRMRLRRSPYWILAAESVKRGVDDGCGRRVKTLKNGRIEAYIQF